LIIREFPAACQSAAGDGGLHRERLTVAKIGASFIPLASELSQRFCARQCPVRARRAIQYDLQKMALT